MSGPCSQVIALTLVGAGLMFGCQRDAPPGIAAATDASAADSGATAIDWTALRRCQARPARPANLESVITPGGRCPADGACLLRSPWFPRTDNEPLAHELACTPLDVPLARPISRTDVAAFRCVLPRGALTLAP